MSIPEEVWNAGSHGNWQDDEKTIHQILETPPVADGFGVLLDADFYCRRRFADDGHVGCSKLTTRRPAHLGALLLVMAAMV